MTGQSVSRRRLLQLASGTTISSLAGCSTLKSIRDDGDEDRDDDHQPSGDTHKDGAHEHNETIGEPVQSAEVSMVTTDGGTHFDPHVVWIEQDGSVTWTNESGSHSTTAYHSANDEPQLAPDEADAWNSDVLSEQGITFDHTFETEGVYHYYCTPHEGTGMIGSVIVGRPDPHDQPALEEPPSEKPEAVREKLAGLNERIQNALNHDH